MDKYHLTFTLVFIRTWYVSVGISLFMSVPHLMGLFGLLMSLFFNSLTFFEYLNSDMELMKIFSHPVGCHFLIDIAPCLIEASQFNEVSFIKVYSWCCVYVLCTLSCLLWQYIEGYSRISILLTSMYMVLCLGFWPIWTRV